MSGNCECFAIFFIADQDLKIWKIVSYTITRRKRSDREIFYLFEMPVVLLLWQKAFVS